MTQSINQKQVCSLICLVNYYRDVWEKCSHLLKSLTALTSKKVKFKWTFAAQNTFDETKQIVNHDTLLIYPDFNKRFDIHTDARKFQLGAMVSQNGKPIYFHIHKLKQPKQRYAVTEK